MTVWEKDVSPGEKKWVEIPVPGGEVLRGMCLRGASSGPRLVVTAGVHGCEYVGVEALRRLIKELEPGEMKGSVFLLPLANPQGFYAGAKQVVPEDKVNLNRAFPGSPQGSAAFRLAWALEQTLYPGADFLADLHSGDCNESLQPLVFFPQEGEKEVCRAARQAAQVLNVPYRVSSTAKNGLYSWAVQQKIPALLIERGCQGLWSEEEVKACQEDVLGLLCHLGICSGPVPAPLQREITKAWYVEGEEEGFWYPQVQAGDMVKKGQLLGVVENLEGSVICRVQAESDGVVLYHTTALGVGKNEPLIAYGTWDEKQTQ